MFAIFAKNPSRLADAIQAKCKVLKSETGTLPVYKIALEDEKINVDGCRRFRFGKTQPGIRNRTIMVLGATGAGKTTLINGMINYILGVEWEDPYRFMLVDEDQSKSQAESQTSEVTVYKINHQEGFKIPSSLTIVDTPGFGDTRGIKRDKEITEQIRNLFSSERGVSEIDAVCFVAQASLARLTPSQKYVLDSVLSIFGKDVAENIQVLVTFADGKRPPVLEAINASGVPCPMTKDKLPVHFKFNNSALFAQNKSSVAANLSGDDDEDFDQMFWKMGAKSMKRFYDALDMMTTKSLTMTKEVLKERKRLEISIEYLQKQVKVGLAKLDEIKVISEQLKLHDAECTRNAKFEIEIVVTRPVQIDISGTGKFDTNCQVCHVTCHWPCDHADDKNKQYCGAMGPDGQCTVCPGKCHWGQHFNQKYRWEYKQFKEKQTVQELKQKYLKASKAKGTVKDLTDGLKLEYQSLQVEVTKMMESSVTCLNRLGEIALRPNPLSTPEYIDLLIEGEKSEGKPGCNERVRYLMEMRGQAGLLARVERGDNLLDEGELRPVPT
ncbi:hypothetical protein OYC64_018466 [Pagothenia borchgrevinki]|uniref:AIG1-type G domain-containing protein n=1 Tax=Pagothenia borchgrevinki TaxID=8213 RepID=A0ABD2GQQ8_PAGBO